MASPPSPRWDIFCRVVDNFGDIGVCWRLARQLVAEYDLRVTLWVDDLAAFSKICPEARLVNNRSDYCDVNVAHWPEASSSPCADVVIEAFACELPDTYINSMSLRSSPPLWLNLEYLSAEGWVEGCHTLPSPQPGALTKYFFFPGFSEATGGLLREADLLERRDAFQTSTSTRQGFLAELGITLPNEALLVSLFCYDQPALDAWLDTIAAGDQPCLLLVPDGHITSAVAKYLGVAELKTGQCYPRGNLQVCRLPFLSQENYDRLLWSCDLNLVRGEDSFVRAQWAGRPMLWHIYPQSEGSHLVKLQAFLTRYSGALPQNTATALNDIFLAWNRGEPPPNSEWLLSLVNPVISAHADKWCLLLSQQKNLAENLVRFSRNWL